MSIAKVLFGLPPLLNIFIALSIPLLYPSLNLAILEISFAPVGSAQTSLAFTPNIASGINGQVNDETVKDLLSIQVGPWKACLEQGGSATAPGGISKTCPDSFKVSFIGYQLNISEEATAAAPNLNATIVIPNTVPISFICSWAFQLVGAFLYIYPPDVFFKITTVVLTALAMASQIVLYNSVKQVAPNLGSSAQASTGTGFCLTIVIFVELVFALAIYAIEKIYG